MKEVEITSHPRKGSAEDPKSVSTKTSVLRKGAVSESDIKTTGMHPHRLPFAKHSLLLKRVQKFMSAHEDPLVLSKHRVLC